MNKKRVLGVLFIFAILFVVSSIIAEESSLEESSYVCLEGQLGDDCGGTNNVEQNAFNLLAISYDSGLQSDCKSSLREKESDNCWGDTGGSVCKIKPSALSILALNHVGADVDSNVNWLLSKRIKNTGLTWFLEIDADNETVCTINGKEFTIREDKKISGGDPSGLRKAYNNYWFEIVGIDSNFTVSCDKDFITALLYQKPGSEVFYVSSETKSAAGHDSVTEKVEAYCFGVSKCDYEGSLWAVLALSNLDEDVTPYIPYLSAMSNEAVNKKYLPSAFLYILTGADDYYSELVNQQKQNKYWDESRNRFYDTSVALLAIGGLSVDLADNAKKFLLDNREGSSCWNSYSSFILYSGWPKNPVVSSGGGGDDGCLSTGYFCVNYGDCGDTDRLSSYCSSISDTCCLSEPQEESCSEKEGVLCGEDEDCSGGEVMAADTSNCCLGTCEEIEDEAYCTDEGYTCKNSCSDDEEARSYYFCDFGESCCAPKEKSGRSWWLIILLIILIILVILAIIFRNQLKIWIFRSKSKFKSGKGPQETGGRPPRPGLPPPGYRGPGSPRQMAPRRSHVPRRAAPQRGGRDKDFDETMKKLKDISK